MRRMEFGVPACITMTAHFNKMDARGVMKSEVGMFHPLWNT